MSKKLILVGPDQVGSLYATADSHKELVLRGMVEQANYRLLGRKPLNSEKEHCRVSIKIFMPSITTLSNQLEPIKKAFIRQTKKKGWKDVKINFMEYKEGEGSFEIDFYA